MKKKMVGSWPFVGEKSDAETDQHLRMKNTAIYWLLSQGIEPDQIHTEHQTEWGRVDVAALLDDGSMIAVECDRSSISAKNRTGMLRDGHQLFALSLDGLYECVGRYGVRRPIDCQLSLGPSDLPRFGQWFANGRVAKQVSVHEDAKWSNQPKKDTAAEDPRGELWAADGKEKPETPLMELPEDVFYELVAEKYGRA